MQIHELTKRRPQQEIDEGLLSGLKAAVNVAKTGADKFASAMVPGYDDVKDAITTGKAGYAQGAGKGKWAGIKQAAKNLADPRASAQAKNTRLQGQAEKDLKDIESKYDIKAKRPLSWYKQQAAEKPELKKQRDDLIPTFDETFDIGVVLPDPGQVLTVELNNAAYYKDGKGQWYQEPDTNNPDAKATPVSRPESIKALEGLIEKDQYSQIATPPALGGGNPQMKKGTQKTTATDQTAPASKIPAANAPQQSGVAQGIAEAVTPGSIAKRSAQRNAPVAAPVAKTRTGGKVPGQVSQTPNAVRQRNARAVKKQGGTSNLAAPVATTQSANKGGRRPGSAKLQKSFDGWIVKSFPEFNEVIKQQDVKSELKQIFGQILSNADSKSAANELFKRYLITLQAGVLRAQAGGQGQPDADQTQQSDIEAKLAQLRGKPIKGTNDPEVNQILKQAGLMINESQVAITKDIVVKTKSGDYVKRHTDQQWYDPNGVRIDPDKYADYIARLDKTPAAQTRYQADSKKGTGSADSFLKSQTKPKAPELDEPEQHATAADWEAYKAQQNAIQNQLIDQTVNDLRNAEYFKTGQEHYLQQQLAQLMAKKF
jgi:hypothetical protein